MPKRKLRDNIFILSLCGLHLIRCVTGRVYTPHATTSSMCSTVTTILTACSILDCFVIEQFLSVKKVTNTPVLEFCYFSWGSSDVRPFIQVLYDTASLQMTSTDCRTWRLWQTRTGSWKIQPEQLKCWDARWGVRETNPLSWIEQLFTHKLLLRWHQGIFCNQTELVTTDHCEYDSLPASAPSEDTLLLVSQALTCHDAQLFRRPPGTVKMSVPFVLTWSPNCGRTIGLNQHKKILLRSDSIQIFENYMQIHIYTFR